jgi:hypothetical protein
MDSKIHGDLIATREGTKTCDLYLAAFFTTAGCKIKETSRDARKVYFLFENTELIEKLKVDYFTRNAKVDALTYADNVKSLKSLCASIMNNEIKRGS